MTGAFVPVLFCNPEFRSVAAMVYTFDSLGYAKRLRDRGLPQDQAEAHAEAARDFIMAELVTKQDLALALETQTLRLTVRLGAMLVVGIGALATILKLA
ncbi:MAG TPA: hypothetical protein VGZ49_07315 [Xanthobacteraceae bacterium]|nr:hypothetical protein [Xanthobacteraceae bacterium]